MGQTWKTTWKGDLYGGVTAAIVALPLALAFGVAAFSVLGPEYAARGALAGLMGALYTGFLAALFGGTPAQVTGPTGPMTVVASTFIADLVAEHGENIPVIILFLGLAVCIGGALQVVFGLLGGGKLVKFMPYPVVAGFMNGIAIIIFLGQIKPFLGITGAWASFDWHRAMTPVIVGITSVAVMLSCVRWLPKVPAALAALIGGIVVYLLMAEMGLAPDTVENNPLVIGKMPNPFASIQQMRELTPIFHPEAFEHIEFFDLRMAIEGGVALAILGSIDSLLTSLIADQITHQRHDSNRELIGQGIGNMVSGLGGGLPGAGATVRTVVNVRAGGRTRLSGMLHALIIGVVAFLGNYAAWIPMAALSGILFVTAVTMVDYYSLRLIKRRHARSEFAVMATVTLITVTVDLMIAVGIGVIIATILFVVQQIKQPVVQRKLRGNEVFSRRRRSQQEVAILMREGAKTLLYELRGALFFGTADALITEVEQDAESAENFIFDFSRVSEIDLSAVKVLFLIVERLQDRGKRVYFSGLEDRGEDFSIFQVLQELGVLQMVGAKRVFTAFYWALENIEDEILSHLIPNYEGREHPLTLRDFASFADLEDHEIEEIQRFLHERSFKRGEILFGQNQPIDHLYFIRSGRLGLWRHSDSHVICLTSLAAGSVVGWRALLDPEHQYLDTLLRADTDGSAYAISHAELESLALGQPAIYIHFHKEVLRYISDRIQILNAQLALLEER